MAHANSWMIYRRLGVRNFVFDCSRIWLDAIG
jgi:hypothetical protein